MGSREDLKQKCGWCGEIMVGTNIQWEDGSWRFFWACDCIPKLGVGKKAKRSVPER